MMGENKTENEKKEENGRREERRVGEREDVKKEKKINDYEKEVFAEDRDGNDKIEIREK